MHSAPNRGDHWVWHYWGDAWFCRGGGSAYVSRGFFSFSRCCHVDFHFEFRPLTSRGDWMRKKISQRWWDCDVKLIFLGCFGITFRALSLISRAPPKFHLTIVFIYSLAPKYFTQLARISQVKSRKLLSSFTKLRQILNWILYSMLPLRHTFFALGNTVIQKRCALVGFFALG